MRKFFRISALTALAVGAMAMSAHAQGKTAGIVAGVDFSSGSGDGLSPGSSARTGFMGGLFVGLPVGGGNAMIEPEVLYSMKGHKFDNADYTGTIASDYIEVPVLFKWSQQPGGSGLYVLAGPAINFNISCTDSGTDHTGLVDVSYDEKCADDPDTEIKTVISGVLGLGYSKGRVGIEGRYDFDLGDAATYLNENDVVVGVKNKVWAILLRVTK